MSGTAAAAAAAAVAAGTSPTKNHHNHLLDGCYVQGGPEGNHKEQSQRCWDLVGQGLPVDAAQVKAMDVVELIDAPDRLWRFVLLKEGSSAHARDCDSG